MSVNRNVTVPEGGCDTSETILAAVAVYDPRTVDHEQAHDDRNDERATVAGSVVA
jgi:hypothetical protein